LRWTIFLVRILCWRFSAARRALALPFPFLGGLWFKERLFAKWSTEADSIDLALAKHAATSAAIIEKRDMLLSS